MRFSRLPYLLSLLLAVSLDAAADIAQEYYQHFYGDYYRWSGAGELITPAYLVTEEGEGDETASCTLAAGNQVVASNTANGVAGLMADVGPRNSLLIATDKAQWLRLRNGEYDTRLRVMRSQDGLLFVESDVLTLNKNQQHYLPVHENAYIRLVHALPNIESADIEHSKNITERPCVDNQITTWLGTVESLPDILQRREIFVDEDANAVWLRGSDGSRQRYQQTQAQQLSRIVLPRLEFPRLELRLPLPLGQASELALKWRLKGGEWQEQLVTAKLDHRYAWRGANEQWQLLSERIELPLAIDKSLETEVEVISASAVYMRISGAAHDDFVFDAKNDPRRRARDALPLSQVRLAEELLGQADSDAAEWHQSEARVLSHDQPYTIGWKRYFRDLVPMHHADLSSQRRWLVPYHQRLAHQNWLGIFAGITQLPRWNSGVRKTVDRQEIFAIPTGSRVDFTLPTPRTSRNVRLSIALQDTPQELLYRSQQRALPLQVLAANSVDTVWPEALMQDALVNVIAADEHVAVARYQWRVNADEGHFQIENKGSETAYISVEYEVAKAKPLSEQRFLSLLATVPSMAVLDWLRGDSAEHNLPLMLARDLAALRDELHRKRAQWLASTATFRELNTARNQFYQQQAKMAAQSRGPSLSDFIDANRRVNSADSAIAIAALAQRNDILIAMGEHDLALSLLKFELVNGGYEISRAASEILRRRFSETGDSDTLALLTAVTFLQHGDANSTAALIRDLYTGGESDEALRLALVWERNRNMPDASGLAVDHVQGGPNDVVTDVLLRAALEAGWQDSFRNRLNGFPSDLAEYWHAYALASAGYVTEARHRLARVSDAKAKLLLSLLDPNPQRQSEALMALPADSIWGRWRASDAAQSGRAHLQRVNRVSDNEPYHRYRVSGADSLRYSLRGDRHLRLELRLVHDKEDERLDRWLRLRINKQWYRLPILGSVASITHKLDEAGLAAAQYPGQRFTFDIEWHGEGELELATDGEPVLAQLQELDLAIGALGLMPLGLACSEQQEVYLDHAIGHVDSGNVEQVKAPLALQGKAFCQSPIQQEDSKASDVKVWPAITQSELSSVGDSDLSNLENLQRDLLAAIFTVQHGGVLAPDQFAKLQAAAYVQRNQESVTYLLDKLNERSEWQKEETVLSMAGRVKLERSWPANSESAGLRRVLGNALPSGLDLRAGESLAVFIDATAQSRLRVTLRAVNPIYRKAVPAAVALALDEQVLATLQIGEQDTVREFPLPQGEHRVVLAFVDALRQNLASVIIEYLHEGQWQVVDDTRDTRVLAASKETPLLMYIHDPSWVRVDRFSHDRVERRFVFHPGGEFNVGAAVKLVDGLFRVHSLRQTAPILDAAPLADFRFYQPAPLALQRSETVLGDSRSEDFGLALFNAEPRRESWATIGAYVKYSERSVLGLQKSGEKQRALELGMRVRKKLADWDHAYWRSDVFERRVDGNNYSIGSENWFDIYPSGRPWTAHLKTDAYYQLSEDALLDQEWSINGDFAIRIPRNFNYKTRLSHEFAVFMHELSIDLADIQRVDTAAMDFDVFNRYRDTHRDGWRYQFDLDYAPYRDAIIQSELRLTGNQHSDSSFADNVRAAVSWQQLYGDWKIDLDYSLTQYLADSDRGSGFLQQGAGLALERAWWQPRWRLNARAYLRLNDGSGGPEAGVELSLDGHHRRGLKDYSPRETAFRDLRILRYRYQRDGLGVVEKRNEK